MVLFTAPALPADVRIGPSSTYSASGASVTRGNRAANSSTYSQCVVARRPSSSPHAASRNAPEQIEKNRAPRKWVHNGYASLTRR